MLTFYFFLQTVNVVPIVKAIYSSVLSVGLTFRGRNHALSQGVGQGVVTSPYLCDLYLRHLTETHLREFTGSRNDFLFRHADDILFLTPNESQARA